MLYPEDHPELFSDVASGLIPTCFAHHGPCCRVGEVCLIREMCDFGQWLKMPCSRAPSRVDNYLKLGASLVAQLVKNLPTIQET